MEEERDTVTFIDDDGNEIELEVLDYFFYNGQEYAVMTEYEECDEDCECGEGCECGHDHGDDDDDDEEFEKDVFIMKVVQLEEGMEEFQPVDEELMDKLIEIVEKRFADDEELDDEEAEDEK